MLTFGICGNDEALCAYAYNCHSARTLLERLRVVHAREANGQQAIPETKQILSEFVRLYQPGTHCVECGKHLCQTTQPTIDLDGAERAKIELINALLAATAELQAREVLPLE